MGRRLRKSVTIMDAQTTTGAPTTLGIDVTDYQHIMLAFATSGTATCKVQFQGSLELKTLDFNAAQSISNIWDYIDVIDLQNQTSVDGDTGISLTATDDVRILAMNVDGLRRINAKITTISAGAVTVKALCYA